MNGTALFYGIMIIIFLVIDGFIVWGIFIEKGKLDQCVNDQSPFCPTIICNDPTVVTSGVTQTAAGKDCGFYAYRYTSDDQSKWECNYPAF